MQQSLNFGGIISTDVSTTSIEVKTLKVSFKVNAWTYQLIICGRSKKGSTRDTCQNIRLAPSPKGRV